MDIDIKLGDVERAASELIKRAEGTKELLGKAVKFLEEVEESVKTKETEIKKEKYLCLCLRVSVGKDENRRVLLEIFTTGNVDKYGHRAFTSYEKLSLKELLEIEDIISSNTKNVETKIMPT